MTLPGRAGEDEVRRLRILYQLLAKLARAEAIQDVYETALASLLSATEADRAAVLLFDNDGVMRFKAWSGLSERYREAVTRHPPWQMETLDARPVVARDVSLDEGLRAFWDVLAGEGIRALASVPLALDGAVFGRFMLYYAAPHECTPDELDIAQAIATHVIVATDRKRMELARAGTEQRLRAILDHSATVIFLKDHEGRYQLVNRLYEELFHVREEDVVGRTDFAIFPREIAERFREHDRQVLAAGKPLSFEEQVPHDDGNHSYISVKFPIEGPDGKVTGVCGIATDISDRKRLETVGLHFAAIVEGSDDAIIAKDLNGVITSWNQGAERLFGYTSDEAIGKPVSILAPPERLDEMPAILARIRRGERVDHFETQRRHKNGEVVDISLTVSPVRNSAGEIIGASKIARDITGRKQAERERAILLSRERDARRTAELLNQVGPRLAVQLDSEKLIQEVIDLTAALVGAEFGAFFQNVVNEKGESSMLCTLAGGRPESFAALLAQLHADVFDPALQGQGILRYDDVTLDPRFRRTAKGDFPARSYLAARVVSRSGEVLGDLGLGHSLPGKFAESHEAILRGIASQAAIAIDNARLFEEAQWAQTELKRSNQELRRANQDLETFAYSASHDLNEPLRTIGISAELIGRECGQKIPAAAAALLARILTSTNHMNALIRDLREYTQTWKVADGPPPAVDSISILASVLETLRGPIDEAGALITHAPLPVVSMHERQLAQLFQNLISNAVKYRGKEVVRVHVSAQERDGWCVFSVADNGLGIDPRFADQIFGVFKRLHDRERYPGSGIGLAICQRIVEQYGGSIWLDKSVLGEGSTFSFSVPIGSH
jgi:PAS domain S-box-containing protein